MATNEVNTSIMPYSTRFRTGVMKRSFCPDGAISDGENDRRWPFPKLTLLALLLVGDILLLPSNIIIEVGDSLTGNWDEWSSMKNVANTMYSTAPPIYGDLLELFSTRYLNRMGIAGIAGLRVDLNIPGEEQLSVDEL